MKSIYARLLKAGIPMDGADRMELDWYLKVLTFQIQQEEDAREPEADGGNIVELRRGTIDQIFR